MQSHTLTINESELAWYERGHAKSPFTLLMLHATGFHSQCWRQVIAALPDDQHVICVDLPGHGASSKAFQGAWDIICSEVGQFIEALDLGGLIGVGHSLGGYTTFSLTASMPERFRGSILIDPVILDPLRYQSPMAYGSDPAVHPTARRRNHWRDWQEMFEHFESRHPFSLWDRRVLRDYCEYGLVKRRDASGYELACPPVVEAGIYINSATRDPLHLFPQVTVPTWVVRGVERDFEAVVKSGRLDFSASPTWPELAARLPNGKDFYWPELSHFIPMQAPERVAALIEAFLDEVAADVPATTLTGASF